MKRNNFKGLWTVAPINEKDVCFSFIEEPFATKANDSVGYMCPVNGAGRFAVYVGSEIVEVIACETYIQLQGRSCSAMENVGRMICDPINQDDTSDLYADLRPNGVSMMVKFYYTGFEFGCETDVHQLFKVIYEDLGLMSMHPDDDADVFVSDTFSQEDADQLDKLLIEAERWCSEHDRDIYHIGLRRLTKAIEKKNNE